MFDEVVSNSNGDTAEALTSELLLLLRNRECGERLTIGEIVEATGGRALGLLLVVLGLPEAIPMVGVSLVLAIPIFLVGLRLALSGDADFLPEWMGRKRIRTAALRRAIDKTLPWIRRLERVSAARWPFVAGAHRVQGFACMLLAVVLAIPVPGLNILAAFGVVGMGTGIVQRDGKLISISLGLCLVVVVGMTVVLTGIWTVVRGAH